MEYLLQLDIMLIISSVISLKDFFLMFATLSGDSTNNNKKKLFATEIVSQ